tara:strand:+ start:2986 stop:4260 length:1275 start_codon:yes stop_codon:yes gene_type:complete
MINFLNKILAKQKINNKNKTSFLEIKKNTNIEKIFNSISNFSEKNEIRYVGGCIRKILNKENVDDIDLATNIKPDEVIKILKKNDISFYESGIDHGTVTAKINNKNFEITSLRKDLFSDGRHAKVEFSNDWLEDASRRDFTINSIYADINGNLYDPFNGKKDLENGEIKFIGDAELRIKEDYLRILRYVRFFLNYSKKEHDPNIKKVIRQNLTGVSKLSSERLLDELKKLLISDGFLRLNENDFCKEIIMLIFPQLINLNLFKNLNGQSLKIFKSGDFIFLISLLIIDNTDNSDYFLYKFNISNKDKKRINFLKEIFSKDLDKKTFSKDYLWKIFYHNNIDYLNDLLNFAIFKSKKIDKKLIDLKEFFNTKNQPIFPIKAKQLIENYNLKEGRELGQKLKQIENIWISNSFKISAKEIEKVINN